MGQSQSASDRLLGQNKNKIRIKGEKVSKEWGSNGVEVVLIRKRMNNMNLFHWGTAIRCVMTQKTIVINRDEGLDIHKSKTLEEAIKYTCKDFGDRFHVGKGSKAQTLQKIWKVVNYGKGLTYIPRWIIKGIDNADHQYRLNNGPKNYEYQLLGKLSSQELDNLFKKYNENESYYFRIVRYICNTYQQNLKNKGNYNLITNNCQHFAIKICQKLGLKQKIVFRSNNSKFKSLFNCYKKPVYFIKDYLLTKQVWEKSYEKNSEKNPYPQLLSDNYRL